MNSINFYEWLGGLIDANGEFIVSNTSLDISLEDSANTKAGCGSIEIIMHSNEIQTLYKIKSICHGQVSHRKRVNAVRWRLHKRDSLIKVLNNLSGNIRVKKRQIQYQKISQLYNIEYKNPKNLTYHNAWFSGFFSGKGWLYINNNNFMATLLVSQKEKTILESIQSIFKGNIYFDKSFNQSWVWQCNDFDCEYILEYLDQYLLYNPYKQAKIRGFKRFLFFKKNNYHLDTLKKKRLIHYIKLLNKIVLH
uniref:LAGLIDADG homing endonuclease n=1 Tax=Prototheca wickerhamii TaxID=3111 RepID=A0A873HW67_PROWI|nr:LAGLIDADG homing endonuclease [Prototheca wickerhamii]